MVKRGVSHKRFSFVIFGVTAFRLRLADARLRRDMSSPRSALRRRLVGAVGVEPTRLAALDPKSSVSAIPPRARFI